MSPGLSHRGGGSTQSLSSNKSSSRHSVSFQLGRAEEQCHGVGHHRQSLPCDGFGHHLLSGLQTGHNGILMRARSTESEPFYGRENHIAGRYTAPPTPSAGRRSYGAPGRDGEGRRSVVTYSYIEKGNIQPAVDSSHSSLCQSEPENPFNRALEEEEERAASLMRNRLSDPARFSSWESLGSSSPQLTPSQRHSLNLRRATMDSIAREATYRALEEFGSPQIRRRLEVQNHQPQDQYQYQAQPRCRSWGGSPVLPRGTSTLPTNAHLMDLDGNHSAHGLPRSPALISCPPTSGRPTTPCPPPAHGPTPTDLQTSGRGTVTTVPSCHTNTVLLCRRANRPPFSTRYRP
ncbi:uncharacterized protein LOC116223200 [Clupea harengus]|uniref:Uncharacterized protein LOC116223200 n=1 Tax=Clupea harengus TaxID=7950 RepID=A0A6P8G6F6_CLUHA|nr:uncharacterized protein LOC116223200 [Clupea harengus]XP_031434949.1 uncharacterized protein LOC116223200 [Clupea harengus]